jgi:Rrf2 family transcriptional regulator, nitric oxide-sensitive transcriptional repressor
MIKFNRTTEYGLMALKHISVKYHSAPQEVTSAREIAESYGIPFEITAKTLQRLKDTGLIQSAHGAKGGYTLARPLSSVSLAEFLQLMEGPQAVVRCVDSTEHDPNQCEYGARCEMGHMMAQLNGRIHEFLSKIQLAELASDWIKPMTRTTTIERNK